MAQKFSKTLVTFYFLAVTLIHLCTPNVYIDGKLFMEPME